MRNYILLLLITCLSCKTRQADSNISCGGKVTIQYERNNEENKNKPKANKNIQGSIVYFVNEYDDDIEVYVDDKLYFEKHIKIDAGSDSLDEYFGVGYQHTTKLPILKVKSKTQNTCFDIEMNKEYKLIYVFLSRDGKWIVRFSNVYYIK